jgi:FkbM family methyltransferase
MSQLAFSKSHSIPTINFKALRYAQFNSAAARAALSLFYRPGSTHRILFGPLRGLRMYYEPSINFHAILGLWEAEILDFIGAIFVRTGLLPKSSVIADVGANIGYYSLWFSRILAPQGLVYAFEPSLDISAITRRNLKLNDVKNIEVIEIACGAEVGTTEFFIADHHHASSIHRDWASSGSGDARAVEVPVTSLDAFFSSKAARKPPSFIKIDIEGGGTHALPGCRNIFQTVRPYVLIESHTVEEDQAISKVLVEHRYRAYRLNDRAWVTNPTAVHPAEDGVWGTMLLIPTEQFKPVADAIDQFKH